MKYRLHRGAILVMMLVFLSLVLIMMIAGARFIALRYHQAANQNQREQAYDAAESGVYYAVWLVNAAGVAPAQLTPITNYQITDSLTHKVVGNFNLSFTTSTQGNKTTVTVTSTGQNTATLPIQQKIIASLESTSGSLYKVIKWDQGI